MKNKLYISQSSYGEHENKLKITDKNGLELFINKLREESIERKLSGMIHFECLNDIADTLLAFDQIEFDNNYASSIEIKDWKTLKEKSKLKMSDNEFYAWVMNGMIHKVANIIDEDVNYSVEDSFFKDFRDFLCLVNIVNSPSL